MVDEARLSVGRHGQKKTENEDGESLGDHFSELVVKWSEFVEYSYNASKAQREE